VPLPFSMLSSFPRLQMRSLPWLWCSVYYTDSSFHDYTPFYFYVLDFI
jgi:hypothetical protein